MPSTKQGGGYTLTFSRKNQDVKEMLEAEKKNGAIISDFICEAVRFYIKNKNTIQSINNTNIDIKHIENLIDQKIKESLSAITLDKKEPSKTELLETTIGISSGDLEDDD